MNIISISLTLLNTLTVRHEISRTSLDGLRGNSYLPYFQHTDNQCAGNQYCQISLTTNISATNTVTCSAVKVLTN